MHLKVLTLVVIFAAQNLPCMQMAVPSRNMASSATDRLASGRYFNQNMYSKDDSKVRHFSTMLLDNEKSNSDKANAQSEPLYGFPVDVLEVEPGLLIEASEPCSKSDFDTKEQPPLLIQPFPFPGLPAFDPLSIYPQLPFPYYIPIPQSVLPEQYLEVVSKEPVEVIEEVEISIPESDAKESVIVMETPIEMPPFPAFPSFYPPPMFYPPAFYTPFPSPQSQVSYS